MGPRLAVLVIVLALVGVPAVVFAVSVATQGQAEPHVATALVGHRSARAAAQGSPVSHSDRVGLMVVEKTGVTEQANGVGGYGLVIRNPTTRDAIGVTLHVHLLDAESNVVATQTILRGLMPAANTYYVGGSFRSDLDPVTSIAVSGTIERSVPYTYALPTVTNLHLVKGPGDLESVAGLVVNIAGSMLSPSDPIDLVYFDSHGHVLGGGEGTIGRALPRDNQETFRVPIRLALHISSVQASIGVETVRHRSARQKAGSGESSV